jgi:hypothetical protein
MQGARSILPLSLFRIRARVQLSASLVYAKAGSFRSQLSLASQQTCFLLAAEAPIYISR